MTVAGKINTFAVALAITAGAIMAAVAIRSEYHTVRERLIERSYNRVQSRTQLQAAIYRGDKVQQKAVLWELLALSPALRFARLLGPDGTVLSEVRQPGSGAYPPLTLSQLRGREADTQSAIFTRYTQVAPAREGLGALATGDLVWDLTIPVLTVVNPIERDLSDAQFGEALARAGEAGSLHVMGYAHLGISRTLLVIGILPAAGLALLLSAGFVALFAVASFLITRRITAPFAAIVRIADDVAAGRDVKTRGLEDNSEFRELVALLNGIIGDFRHRRTQMEVDHQLLSMKVEERTSQLSERNRELNEAVREVTETRDRLHQLAYYDSLTALPNRRLFTEQLDLLLRLAKRHGQTLALLFLDLDNFKRINDSLGHSAGDLLLREVARRLARCIRDSDLVGHNVEPNSAIDVSRLGGDEFTVVLNQLAEPESAGTVARRLLEALTAPMTIEGHELVVTPSIGIAVAPRDADTVEGLLKAADTAMYHAKAAGKNQCAYYSPDMEDAGVERLTLENDLRKALENGELLLHYQPQVDTLTGNVVGAEALMRWEHPEQGMIPPFKFIPLAEEMGLIGALGEWGLEEACRQMVALQAAGLNLPKVSVNVSALQFTPAFIRRVREVLGKTGLHPRRLELELTEGIMLDGSQATIEALADLKDLGVRLSIDDFGTGYSSLSYLSRFPLDELKIDRSFVVEMESSANDASLVVAIIAMARSMKLGLVAEGVENQEQYRFLRQHGASVIQGYMFSKPVAIDDLKPLLAPGHFREQIKKIDNPR